VVTEHLDAVERRRPARAGVLAAIAQSDGGLESGGLSHGRRTVPPIPRQPPSARARRRSPIVVEDHPNFANPVGWTEYSPRWARQTDFASSAGALHRANGGYLVLEADKVLMEPYAWEELKRALDTGGPGPLGQSLGLLTTATLEPEPIPLDIKVALIGDRRLYYLLCAYDREFLELFKVP
jgi:predicted ATP-dependent protease